MTDPIDLEAHYQASIAAWHREQRDPAATLTHDPDGWRGCDACPVVDGRRCAPLDKRLDHDSNSRLIPDPECPLRRGDVVVRRPR